MKFAPITKRDKRPNWLLLCTILLFHVAAFYGLARALAPQFTQSVERDVASALQVTVSIAQPPEPPEAPPKTDEGAQGDPGKQAVAREVTAPEQEVKLPNPSPAPRASSTGNANRSGANDRGDGTGGAGTGQGPGSGRQGNGSGNAQTPDQSRKPSILSGSINDARDFPVPEGGRAARFGKSVTVVFTVTTDGRAKNCSVANSSVDGQTSGLLCGLVMQKIRFNPALDRDGNPVEARYGYRQSFSAR